MLPVKQESFPLFSRCFYVLEYIMSVEHFRIFIYMKEHKDMIELLLEDNEEQILILAQNKAIRLCLEGIFGFI